MICSLNTFHLYNIVTMLYIRSSDFIHLKTESLKPCYQPLPISAMPPALDNPHSTILRVKVFLNSTFSFRFHMLVIPCSICLCLSFV